MNQNNLEIIERYTKEAGRIYHVLDKRLTGRDYLVDGYSIADMAVFPWIRLHGRQGQALEDYPELDASAGRSPNRRAAPKQTAAVNAAVLASNATEDKRGRFSGASATSARPVPDEATRTRRCCGASRPARWPARRSSPR